MAQVYKCDRCGDVFEKLPQVYIDEEKDIKYVLMKRSGCNSYPFENSVHLCENCTNLLYRFMANKTVYSTMGAEMIREMVNDINGGDEPKVEKKRWFRRRK